MAEVLIDIIGEAAVGVLELVFDGAADRIAAFTKSRREKKKEKKRRKNVCP